jgi:predicted phage terminase large subunit-like protein
LISLSQLERRLNKALEVKKPQPVKLSAKQFLDRSIIPPVLLPYQQQFLTHPARVRCSRKSRRIGMSWAIAGDCALDAARANGRNCYYLGFDKEMSSTFIHDAAHWAKAYNLLASEVEEIVLRDEDEDIIAYRIRFASGHGITALSSKPRNIRSKEGRFIFDEFAFHDDPEGLLKAGIAVLMWGKSQIDIISSVNGNCEFFEELCGKIAQERGYYVQQTTLDDALLDGLYKRICFVNGWQWTIEAQDQWRSQLIKEYGIAADEELFCIPFKAGAGKVFNRDWFEVIDWEDVPEYGDDVRFWDMAATAKSLNQDACFTCGVKLRHANGIYYVLDVLADQLSPSDGDDLIVDTAKRDGRMVPVRWELEGGSSGLKVESYLMERLKGYDARGVRPMGDKLTRAKPFASEANLGNVKIVRATWNSMYLKYLHSFDGGSGKDKVNDFADASSGAFQCLTQGYTGWLEGLT